MRKTIIYMLIFTAAIQYQCTQKKATPVGSELFGDDAYSSVNHLTIYGGAEDTTFHVTPQMENSEFLYAGQMGDMQAVSLFRFTGIEDTASLDSAVILINVVRVLNAGIPFHIYLDEMTVAWEDSTLLAEDFNESMLGSRLISYSVTSDSVDSLRFRMEPGTVAAWMDSNLSDLNNGICLRTDGNVMLQCYSRDISASVATGPQILLYFTDDSTRYPKTVEASSDIFLGYSDFTPVQGQLFIENGTAYRSFLSFDLTGFPENSVINRALLVLDADTTFLIPDADRTPYVIACYTDSSASYEDIEFESHASASGKLSGQQCRVDMTYQIQTVISEKLQTHGFVVKGQDETSELGRIVFFSTEADSALRPRFEIDYTLPIGSEF